MKSLDSNKYFIVSLRRDSGPEQVFVGDQFDIEGDFLCSCNGVAGQYEGEAVRLVFRTVPMNTILGAFPALAVHIAFLEILKKHGFAPIEGPVYAKKGQDLVETHRSIYVPCREGVGLRGGIGSKYRMCFQCGMIWNRDAGDGVLAIPKPFIRGRDVLFIDARSQLAVSELVAEEIRGANFRDLRLDEIPLVDSPYDGLMLPGDPDWREIDSNFVLAPGNDWKSPW